MSSYILMSSFRFFFSAIVLSCKTGHFIDNLQKRVHRFSLGTIIEINRRRIIEHLWYFCPTMELPATVSVFRAERDKESLTSTILSSLPIKKNFVRCARWDGMRGSTCIEEIRWWALRTNRRYSNRIKRSLSGIEFYRRSTSFLALYSVIKWLTYRQLRCWYGAYHLNNVSLISYNKIIILIII